MGCTVSAEGASYLSKARMLIVAEEKMNEPRSKPKNRGTTNTKTRMDLYSLVG